MTAKLARQLRRELKANPKKAVFLALMLIVAIYFWAPLLTQWTSSEASAPRHAEAQTSASSRAVTLASPHPLPAQPAAQANEIAWHQLAAWMEADAWMQSAWPASSGPADRNPFAPPATGGPSADDEPLLVGAASSPRELGLELTSTVVGTRRKTAVINGKVYSQGAEVTAGEGTVFVLTRVDERRVILSRAGRHFELVIVRDSAGRMNIGTAR